MSSVTVVRANGKVEQIKIPYWALVTVFHRDMYLVSQTSIGDKIFINGSRYVRVEKGFKPFHLGGRY